MQEQRRNSRKITQKKHVPMVFYLPTTYACHQMGAAGSSYLCHTEVPAKSNANPKQMQIFGFDRTYRSKSTY